MGLKTTCLTHFITYYSRRNAAIVFVLKKITQEETSTSGSPEVEVRSPPEESTGLNNQLLAGGAALAGIALFLFTRLGSGVSFSDLQSRSVSLDTALANGKPTVVEFYATWCVLQLWLILL